MCCTVANQQQQLSDWCSRQVPSSTSATAISDVDATATAADEHHTAALGTGGGLLDQIAEVSHHLSCLCFYTVSTKKLYPCICCHNSGKQRRILTKFYANTETLNCKQVTKFQQNRSTSATATASLVKSLKSISVHYRHRRD